MVDIATNYIVHAFGQPPCTASMQIRLKAVEGLWGLCRKVPFVTLDGVERKLNERDLMICKQGRGDVAVGVFGWIRFYGNHQGCVPLSASSSHMGAQDSPSSWIEHRCFSVLERGIDLECHHLLPGLGCFDGGGKLAGGTISSEIKDVRAPPCQGFPVWNLPRESELY